ncbi:MAG: AAA family ATPase, partial [Athalassotoga sp.]|uniref:AAA family ATPase n=1 Tax=Athalassotoga sp. TaxID=2022597 RepID=UPI003D01FD1C
MISEQIIETLELNKMRKIQRLPQILRPFFEKVEFKNRAVMILGSRGVGKTTFMLSKIKDKKIFYLSADNPLTSTSNLY